MEKNESKKSIQDKLATIKYNCSSKTHLICDNKKCVLCKEKTCTFICPAEVYSVDEDGTTIAQYENCLECGACKIACPYNAIGWCYPSSGCGVVFKNS